MHTPKFTTFLACSVLISNLKEYKEKKKSKPKSIIAHPSTVGEISKATTSYALVSR